MLFHNDNPSQLQTISRNPSVLGASNTLEMKKSMVQTPKHRVN